MGRRGGIIELAVNGVRYDAKGNFTYNLGAPKREAIIGADRVHDFKEMVQVPFVEGEITDAGDLRLLDLVSIVNATVTLRLSNNKTVVLSNAWFAGEGTGNTEEGNVAVRFEGTSAEELPLAA